MLSRIQYAASPNNLHFRCHGCHAFYHLQATFQSLIDAYLSMETFVWKSRKGCADMSPSGGLCLRSLRAIPYALGDFCKRAEILMCQAPGCHAKTTKLLLDAVMTIFFTMFLDVLKQWPSPRHSFLKQACCKRGSEMHVTCTECKR